MKWMTRMMSEMNLLYGSISFFKNHFLTIVGLGLIAAFGRVIQLGGFGEIPSWANITLEVVVETSRLLIILFVLGIANIKRGAYLVKRLFIEKNKLKTNWTIAMGKLKSQWVQVAVSFCGLLIIAVVINFLIDTLAYETCLYLTLKREGILADTSSEWTILLFFKNILVIPFTLVFETIVLLWMTNKISFSVSPSSVKG